jgi:predicted permease
MKRRARTAFFRRVPEKEIDEEIAFHIDRRTQEYIAAGMNAAEARAEALRRFGYVSEVRAETVRIDRAQARRESLGWLVQSLRRDLRIAWRALRKSPAFALAATACIALGVCVTTTIGSAVDAILIRPLPYPAADRLVAVYSQSIPRGYHATNISYKDYASWRDLNRSFSALGIWTWVAKTITEGESERVPGASVSANLFPLLGVRPLIGRTFTPDEERVAAADVIMLSYGLWQRRFGGDRGIVGRAISMDGRPHVVVGVMPPHFNFPEQGEFWMPFAYDHILAGESHGDRGYAGAIGRLKPGVSLAGARADLERVSRALRREFPQDNTGWSAELKTMRDDLTGDLRRPVLVFFGAVALVLLIACANVANLMLARGMARQREMAVRSALGAGRGDLVRQLMTESVALATIGGIVGAAFGASAVQLARFAFPNGVPFYFDFGVDARALGFAALVIALTAVFSGIVPALRATHIDINAALRQGDRGDTGGGSSRARAALVVGELALSALLLVGGVLLVRSYEAYEHTNLGFDRDGILTVRVTLPEKRFDEYARRVAFFEELQTRLRALPGVTDVGSAQGIPFSGWDVQGEISFPGRPRPRPNEEFVSHFQSVSPRFFAAMGIPVVRGRPLEATDRDTLAPVAVVNETFAKRAFPHGDAIGQRARYGTNDADPWYTIVGVVRDFRHYRLPEAMGPALYTAYAVAPSRSQTLVIRTRLADPYALVPDVRSVLRTLDPQLAVYDVKTMRDAVDQSFWRQRLESEVLGVFAALAVALAMVGVYGLISYTVAQRTREIGVRVALGAPRRAVLGLVVSQAIRLLAAGLVIGLSVALLLSHTIASLLYGVAATDIVTFVIVAATLIGVTLLATSVPAMRAARVDPLLAMRIE